MKISHKINHGWAPDRTDPVWAERVEREAEATSAARQRAYDKAQTRLARLEARLERAQERAVTGRRVTALRAEVERRREELRDLDRLMRRTSAPSTARGRKSHRSVPSGGVTP